jgi:hypothetical protein
MTARSGASRERYGTVVRDGVVYVEGPDRPVEVGPEERVVGAVGGPAWRISYSDWQRERYDLDDTDEGLVVDVRDMLRALEHDRSFVDALAACPREASDDTSPRLELFVGKLLENLQSGLS